MLINIIDKFCRWIDQNPCKSLRLIGLIVLLLLPGIFFNHMNYGIRLWFRANDSMILNYDNFIKNFGPDDAIFLTMESPGGVFHPETLQDVRDITHKLWGVKNIEVVDTLLNYPMVEYREHTVKIDQFLPDDYPLTKDNISKKKEIALNHPVMPRFHFSKDLSQIHFNIRLVHPGIRPNYAPIYKELKKILDPYRVQKNYKFYKIGTATGVESFRVVALEDLKIMFPVLLILITFILFFLLRDLITVSIPLIIITATIGSTMGISGYLGIDLNNLSSMAPTILLAICIADSIHIIVSYVKNIHRDDVGLYSLKKNFAPTLLTSISTAIGFFSLSFSDISPMRHLGYLCGVGTLLAWLFSIMTITPLLQILTKNKKRLNKKDIFLPKKLPKILTNLVLTHRKKIITLTLVTTLFATYIGSKNEINSNIFEYFDKSTDIWISNQTILKKFDGFNGIELVLDSGKPEGIFKKSFLQKVERLKIWLEKRPYINRAISLIDQVKPINKAFHQNDPFYYSITDNAKELRGQFLYFNRFLPAGQNFQNIISSNQNKIRMSVFWNLQKTKRQLLECKKIEKKMKELSLTGYITGREYLYNGMNKYVVHSFFTSIGISILLISLLMILSLKSIKLGLISIIPNITPIAFGAMITVLTGRPIDAGTVIVASVCFGIAIDDTIHIMFEYVRLKARKLDPLDILVNVFENTGVALITTTLVLVGGFGTFVFAKFIPNWNFGVLSSLVLLIALIIDLTFLPALLVTFKSNPDT